jgi:hypothetical protein
LIAVGAQVNAKRVTVDFTGSWDLIAYEYCFDADTGQPIYGPIFIDFLPPGYLIGDQKPNGTFTGAYLGSDFIDYGTWEDIGDAVVYSVNSDNNVEDGVHAYYEYQGGSGSQLIVESMGYTINKNDSDVGYGSITGLKYNLDDGQLVGRVVRVFTIYRNLPD